MDLLAPPRCIYCLREGVWLCRKCEIGLPLYSQSCLICATADRRGLTCRSCQAETAVIGLLSAGPYQALVFRRAVAWLKFKGVRSMADTFARLMMPKLLLIAPANQLVQKAVFLPMPLHSRRLAERGFNQSEDIAQALSSRTAIPVVQGLSRTRSTFIQSKLPTELRTQNVSGAFTLENSIPVDRQIAILIDDVVTTGATLSSAAEALHPTFSGQIWAVTMARG